jgi:Transposase DDE domain group 1
VRLLQGGGRLRVAFDDPNLVSDSGLVPAMELAESCDLHGIVAEHVRIDGHKGANPEGKVATLVAGMLTGADSIDDTDELRHGGMPSLFGGVYAPSTLGEFLRSFSHGHVRQLQAAAREFLVQLARRRRLLPGADGVVFLDVDSLLRRVYGKKKQGAAFGHAKVGGYQLLLRGLNPLIATLSTPDAAPLVIASQLRAGNAGSARGASSLLAEAIGTAKAVLAAQHSSGGELVARADSAFFSKKFVAACRRAKARFSVTIPVTTKVRTAIATIPDDAWVEITYPHPVWDEDQQRFISRAQVAETTYTAFTGRWRVTARLIVRRVPDERKSTVDDQGVLFPIWRYHAIFTDSPFILVQAEEHHRAHAIVEQLFAELIDGPLAHLPSGKFNANNAWLTCIGIAHNLTRAVGVLAGLALARARTIRKRLINVAGSIARHARTATLHMPEHWPWQHQWLRLWNAVHVPPWL